MTVPATTSRLDGDQARNLRRMKMVATGLLGVAAAVYVVARAAGDRTGVVGLVEATAEAAMVGALADWFAVTALFRHPLGIPIPHTAIIPTRKDAIGASLGSFVQENFLDEEIITERVMAVEPSRRLAEWLAAGDNVGLVTDQLAVAVSAGVELLDDEQVRAGFERLLVDWLDGVDLAPVGGRVVEFGVDGGHHQAVVDTALRGVQGLLRDNETLLRNRLGDASPWFVPEPIDDRVFDRLFGGIMEFLVELAADVDHPMRRSLDERARLLARRLRTSPELRERGDELKAELLAHPVFRQWTGELWTGVERAVRHAADTPDSELRRRLDEAVRAGARQVATDPDLQHKLDRWLAAAVRYVADQAGDEVAELITTTVARWDADETSRRIELQVGRDLQFIRINGTLVGGLAGAAIHLVSTTVG